ncbi:UTP--glucose-1-phosphate uridylyltransferase [Ornithinimicrobium avium]|uniref:UTP--glucose-1-phosphate uridylyltransferase n=2 Tax=Ornithinimicrobium avium TaxID=2283195 RepID=A0A345NQK6_9MICO|nr:UTP--glucose-1-phosphate uridylyltransferase [Ornithinimicrobium avium]
MRAARVSDVAVEVFRQAWTELARGDTGTLAETQLEPVTDLDSLQDLDPDAEARALGRTAVVKLNGGLGTSMGMDRAKSLVPVREGRSFLELTIDQVRHARERSGARLPLVLMNSFRTREDSLAVLAEHPDLPVDGVDADFLQSQEPKLLAGTLAPVQWPADPDLEWCPPGHGDLYPALLASGMLEQLRAAGFRYAMVSNSDNVGAAPSAAIADWFARSGAPLAMEVCRRTAADRKGGHLAVRRSDGQLVLREKAQTAPEDADAFADVDRHRFFNTNTLWLDLDQVASVLKERGGVLGLPLIRNEKTVDPTDPTSPRVVQVETAMGSAIEVFEGATAIEVPRTRFRPVKTTDDLLLLRSDAFELTDDARLEPVVDPLPLVTLGEHYRTLAAFECRFPHGAPSLREASSLTVEGDWTFGAGVRVVGDALLGATPGARPVPDDATVGPDGVA